jgi:hypothetical protein
MYHGRHTTDDIPLDELRRILRDTIATAGAECDASRILRRIVERRKRQAVPRARMERER